MSDNWIVDRLQAEIAEFTSEASRLAGNATEIVTPKNPETAKRPDAATASAAISKASNDATAVAAALGVVLAQYQAGTLPAAATKVS